MTNSHMSLKRAIQIPGEEAFLDALVDNLGDDACKLIYADWLEEHGDATRATFLRQYAQAYQSMKVNSFPEFGEVPIEWARMTGAKLAYHIAERDMAEMRDDILALAQPALLFESDDFGEPTEDFEIDQSIPVGGTKQFGLPDLPPGSVWPRQKDCNSLFMPDSGIDPETLCSFVAQINFAEFAGTQASRLFPDQGLVSFFSCSEIESIGMVDGLVIFTPDTDNLERMTPPPSLIGDEADEANAVFDAKRLTFSETLQIPYPSDESPFDLMRLSYDDENYDRLADLRDEADAGELESFLGFTRATTGDDPMPGADYCKLLCIQNTIEIMLYFCLRNADLAAGRFDRVEMPWVDFD